jgi:hypothetical protein
VRASEGHESPARPPRSAPARGHNGKQPESSFSSTPVTKEDNQQRNTAPENVLEVNKQKMPPNTASAPEVEKQPKPSPRTVKTLMNNTETPGVDTNAMSRAEDAAALERIEQELLRPARYSRAISDSSQAVPLPTSKIEQSSKVELPKPSATIERAQDDRASVSKIEETSDLGAHTGKAVKSSKDELANSSPATTPASRPAIDRAPNSAPATIASSPKSVPAPNSAPANTRSSSPKSDPFSSPKNDQHVEVGGMDVDIDVEAYLNSTDAYSVVSGGQHDAMSVYTAGTNMTQSSRVRRPGAAKARLAKAKQVERETKKGWHESILAAAASTNRVWDPTLGWVDYEEPDGDVLDSCNEKIHIDLDKNALRRPKKDEGNNHLPSTGGSSVPVPFPKEWEKERNDMLYSVTDESATRASVVRETETKAADELDSKVQTR